MKKYEGYKAQVHSEHLLTHQVPVLPSYRNQSIDLHQLTGFYIRATLALYGLSQRKRILKGFGPKH